MVDQSTEVSGDFVRVATCATPTEAHLLKGVLESNGLKPFVADGNIVQANPWMTQAVGGVRVLVPASQVDAAARAIAEFNAGTYQLEDEKEVPVVHAEQPAAVFSPDQAALLGFFLTPVFPAAIQMANAGILGQTSHRIRQWLWLLFLSAASVASIALVYGLNSGPYVLFKASFFLWTITAFWYFVAGQQQSRELLTTYGPKYMRRGLFKPAITVAVGMLAIGWVLSEFA